MTTLFPVRPAQLYANVRHQAKRLKDSLQIPLTAAQRVLAKAAYQCSSWNDLLSRLESTAIQHPALMLSLLPHAPEAKAYLHEHVHQISRAIGGSVLTNRNLAGMYKVTRFVFENADVVVELPDL